MADKMDRGLDDIIADSRPTGPRNRRGQGQNHGQGRRREPRQDFPRDGIKKSYRDDSRNLDSEWVHDRYDDSSNNRRGPAPRRRRESPEQGSRGTKLRVENIHYDLTEEDLDELFKRIGPITRLQLRYDRAGRSEGTAYVTYEQKEDAQEAVRQFDGANANGQPIRLTLLSSANPFDSAIMPGRPLAERISAPGSRNRSQSPRRRYEGDDASRKGIDRYIPGQGGRPRSPMPRRRGGNGGDRGGRRPGARREGNDSGREDGRGGRNNQRSKKTQEELDAEMADYFGGGNAQSADSANDTAAPATSTTQATASAQAPAHAPVDDIDMIE